MDKSALEICVHLCESVAEWLLVCLVERVAFFMYLVPLCLVKKCAMNNEG